MWAHGRMNVCQCVSDVEEVNVGRSEVGRMEGEVGGWKMA